MSTTIDQKVVEMQFDNKNFEENVKTSMSTLDKLKEKLNFDGVADGLKNLGGVFDNFTLGHVKGLGEEVDNASHKFSILEQIGIGALRKIGDEALEMGQKILKGITSMDQFNPVNILKGWDKYASKTEAIQTIMAATAKQYSDQQVQIAEVSAELEKLNWFTDETSYRFIEMVNSIGKFTSAGVKLDRSVSAMQGIAQWAAVSGQTAETANRAFYSLSQAMGTGKVTTYNWRSIELANMATMEFKEQVLKTAEAMGVLKKKSEGVWTFGSGKSAIEITAESFRQSLEKGWFSKDVLVNTLQEYGDFTNALYGYIQEMNEFADGYVIVSDVLEFLDRYKDGTIEMEEATEELGLSAERLEEIFKDLLDPKYALGFKSFKAAQEAKTFKEAIDSVIEASTSKWMNLFERLFGNYLEAKKLWTKLANQLYDVFVEPLNIKIDILDEAFASPLDKFGEALKEAGVSTDTFMAKAKELGMASGKLTEDILKNYEDLEDSLRAGWLDDNLIVETLERLAGSGEAATQALSKTKEEYEKVVKEVIRGNYGNGKTRMDQLAKAGWEYRTVQKMVNEYLDTGKIDFEKYSESVSSAGVSSEKSREELLKMRERIRNGDEDITSLTSRLSTMSTKDMWTKSLYNAIDRFTTFVLTIREGYDEAISPMERAGFLKTVFAKLFVFTSSLKLSEENASKLKNTITNLITGFRNLYSVFKTLLSSIFDPLNDMLGGFNFNFLDMLEVVTKWFSDITGKIKDWAELKNVFTVITTPIRVVLAGLGTFYSGIMNMFAELNRSNHLKNLGEGVAAIAGGLKSIVTGDAAAGAQSIGNAFKMGAKAVKDIKILDKLATNLVKTVSGLSLSMADPRLLNPITLLKTGFAKLREYIPETFSSIEGFIKQHKFIENFVNTAETWIGKLIDFIIKQFSKVVDYFKGKKYEKWLSFLSDGINAVWKVFKGGGKDVLDYIKDLYSFLSESKDAERSFTGFVETATEKAEDLKEETGGLLGNLKKIKEFLGGGNNLFEGFSNLGDIKLFSKTEDPKKTLFAKFMDNAQGRWSEELGNFKNKYIDQINSISTASNAFIGVLTNTFNWVAEGIKNYDFLSKAIVVFAGVTLIKISKGFMSTASDFAWTIERIFTPLTDTFKTMGQSIGFAFDKWASAGAALTSYLNAKSMMVYVGLFKSLARSILMLAGAMFVLSSLKPEELIHTGARILALMTGLVLAVFIVSKSAGTRGSKAIAAFRGVGLAVARIVGILAMVALKFKDANIVIKDSTVYAIAGAITLMFLIVAIMNKNRKLIGGSMFNETLKQSFGTALKLIRLTVMLTALTKAISNFLINCKYIDPASIIVPLAAIGAFGFGIVKLFKTQIALTPEIAKAILLLVSTIFVLAAAVKAISGLKVDYGRALKNLLAIAAVVAALAGVLWAVKVSQIGNAIEASAKTIALAAGAVLMMTLAVRVLSGMKNQKGLLGAVLAVGGLLIFAGIFMNLTSFLFKQKTAMIQGSLAIIAAAFAIDLMAVAVAAFSFIPAKKLAAGTRAVAVMLLSLGRMLWGASQLKDAGRSLLVLAFIVGELTIVLGFLSMLDETDALIAASRSISLIIGAFARLFFAISFIKNGVGPFSGNKYEKIGTTVGHLLTTLVILIGLTVVIAGALYLLSQNDPKAIINAGIAMAATVTALGLRMLAMTRIPVDFTAAPGFVSGLVTMGIIVAVLGGILTIMAKLDPEGNSLAQAKALSNTMIAFAAAFAIISFAGTFASRALPALVPIAMVIAGMAVLAGVLGTLESQFGIGSTLEKGFGVLNTISTGVGEFVGHLVGGAFIGMSEDLVDVGENLSDFADESESFFTMLKDISAEDVTAIETLKELIKAAGDLNLTSGSSTKNLGGALGPLGEGLANYGTQVTGITDSDIATIDSTIPLVDKLFVAVGKIPPDAGKKNDAFKYLPNNSEYIGQSLIKFVENTSGLTEASISQFSVAADASEYVATIINTLYGTKDTLLSTSDGNGGSFAYTLTEYAKGLSAFYYALEEFDFSGFSSTRTDTAQHMFADIGNTVSARDTGKAKVGKDVVRRIREIATIAPSLKDMFVNFSEATKSAKDYDEGDVTNALVVYSKFLDAIVASQETYDQMDQKKVTDVANLSKVIADSVKDRLNDKEIKNWAELWISFIGSINKHIEDTLEVLKAFVPDFIDSGKNFVKGIKTGLEDGAVRSDLIIALVKLGTEMLATFNKSLNEHSPSKATEESGVNFVQGFVNGIIEAAGKAKDAVLNMGNNVKESFMENINKFLSDNVAGMLDGSLDLNPVISPVLDLSQLQAGIGDVNGIFNSNKINMSRTGLNLESIKTNFASITGSNDLTDLINNAKPSNITFTQNNYSPKSLSRMDIYRQTRNQLNAMKGLMRV